MIQEILQREIEKLSTAVDGKTQVNDTASDSADDTYSVSKIEGRVGTEILITNDYVLPSVSDYSGKRLIIINIDSIDHTVSGGIINGETSQTLSPDDAMHIYSNGSVWRII